MLKWIFERVTGSAEAIDTPIGRLPAPGALDMMGMSVGDAAMSELLRVDTESWLAEIPQLREHYAKFGDRLPKMLADELTTLEKRLAGAKVSATR